MKWYAHDLLSNEWRVYETEEEYAVFCAEMAHGLTPHTEFKVHVTYSDTPPADWLERLLTK